MTPVNHSPPASASAPAAASTPATGRLAGKVALITGAAGNLGSFIVRHDLREGATVVLTGRNRVELQALRDAPGAACTAQCPAAGARRAIDRGARSHGVVAGCS